MPFGAFQGAADGEFDFRVRLSKLIVEYEVAVLESKRKRTGVAESLAPDNFCPRA